MAEMKTCTLCGESKPATLEFFYQGRTCLQARCKPCMNRQALERRSKNMEQYRAYQAAYYEDPSKRAAASARSAAFQKQNPDRAKKVQRAWRERNLEDVREISRVSRVKYREKYPERVKAAQARASAKRVKAEGEFTGHDVKAIFVRQGGCCLYCGEKIRPKKERSTWHCDHFIPLSRGGSNSADNIVVACATCNLSKHNKMPWEFMPERFPRPETQAAD